jgi:predicted PurR-regulated permease PerM
VLILALTINTKVWQFTLLFALALTAVFSLVFYFENIFVTFIIGFALILVTRLFLGKLEKLFGRFPKDGIFRFLSVAIVIVFWLGFIYYLVSFTSADMGQLMSTVRESNQGISTLIGEKVDTLIPKNIQDKFFTEDYILRFTDFFGKFLADTVSSTASILVNSILIIPLLFYIYFARRRELADKILELVPIKFKKAFEGVYNDASNELYSFFTAKLVESFIIACVCAIGFYFGGLKGWLFLAILAGFLNIIPYLGPFLGAIPPLFLAFVHPSITTVYWVLGTIVVAQLLDNLYIIPFMISSKVKIDPLLSLVLILVGAKLLGPLGMILAIPVYSVYRVTLMEVYRELVKVYDPKLKR